MSQTTAVPLTVAAGERVSALLTAPSTIDACVVLAHGAGAGMTHPFMERFAQALGARRLASFRYQFPSMERGARRPDSAPVAHATVRAAVAKAAELLPSTTLLAGGKSFGGRMTSQAQAASPLPGVRGLVFAGFPLHPAGKPGDERARHLADVSIPMLFLQGDRDALAELVLLRPVVEGLGPSARLAVVPGADHAFHVPVRSGRTDADVIDELAEAVAQWTQEIVAGDAATTGMPSGRRRR